MKQPLNPRRIFIRTAVIVLFLLVACFACNLLAYRYLPFPNG
jgi:hypothetical protein